MTTHTPATPSNMAAATSALATLRARPTQLDAAMYLQYTMAGASYCSNASLAAWNCTPCKRSNTSIADLVVYENTSTDARAFTAAITPQNSRDQFLVLSWRGTETLENWIENLKFLKTDRGMSCEGCKVHSGFYDSWMSLRGRIVPELRRLRIRHPRAPLIVTGHSLGGALATLSAYALAADIGVPVDSVYTYGSPRVGNAPFARAALNRSEWRVTHHRDVVPHLPPKGRLFGFWHTATEIFYANESHAGKLCDGSGEDKDCSNQYLFSLSVDDHLHYFGETIGIYGCGDSGPKRLHNMSFNATTWSRARETETAPDVSQSFS